MKLHKNNMIVAVMLVLAITFLMTEKGIASCDMMAMIAKKGHYISWCYTSSGDYNDPYDFFDFIRERSTNSGWKPNNDGYGFIYYPEDGSFDLDNQAWYLTGEDDYYYHLEDPNHPNNVPLDNAEQVIMDNDTKASIVFGHARCAGSTYVYGSHPFRFEWNGQTYTFMHNGEMDYDLRSKVEEYLGNWYLTYYSNWQPANTPYSQWIDSEVLFHYIMKHIVEVDGDVLEGLHNALNYSEGPYTENVWYFISNPGNYYNIVNFVLSDGKSLYLFRNRDDNTHRFSYKKATDFYVIKTYDDMENVLEEKELVIISPYGVSRIPNIMKPQYIYPPMQFVKGEILEDLNCPTVSIYLPRLWFTGDVNIPEGTIINITGYNASVGFATNITFNIDGTLNINEGTGLHINHGSEIIIDVTDAQLFLDWGSKITGSTPLTWEQTPPGHEIGGEHSIPGDRIIAKNGGMITTPAVYAPGEDPIIIESSSGKIWDGIIIEDPVNGEDDVYWFTNCDISGIQEVSMKGDGNLSFYKSDLYDAGGIIVRDDATLTIRGCNIDGWINAYSSQLIMEQDQDDVGNEVYGNTWASGIYLRYTSTNPSQIYNTNIHHNYYGCSISDHLVNFEDCEIYENSWFGIANWKVTLPIFESNYILNNGAAEFIGNVDSYFGMVNCGTKPDTIRDDVDSGGWDTYLLVATDWQEGDPQIDVSDNTFIPHDISRFCPPGAFIIDNGIPEEERILLSSAIEDMNNKNYEDAEITLKQIITDYPESNETVVAVKCLYFIENFTEMDFAEFRAYLDEIEAEYGTQLYKMKEDVKTKTYMDEQEFITAIERLEEVINNPPTPDDSIYAMIDEGYCYLKLAEDSTRAMPISCSVRPSTFAEYQENVRELESRLSFFNNIDYAPYPTEEEIAILNNNYPNPFNSKTRLSFTLPYTSDVEISIYNIKGQKIKTLINTHLEKGKHNAFWNGKDNSGKQVSSGIYLYKLSTKGGSSSGGKAENRTVVKKMLLLK